MGFSDIGLRHIVDIDGQLLGIDAEMIDTTSLLARANCPEGSLIWMVHAGERVAIEPRQIIRLSEQSVTFFETSSAACRSPFELMAA